MASQGEGLWARPGGQIMLSNQKLVHTDRWPDQMPVVLNSGRFILTSGQDGQAVTEQIGKVQFSGVGYLDSSARLVIPGFDRVDRGLLKINGRETTLQVNDWYEGDDLTGLTTDLGGGPNYLFVRPVITGDHPVNASSGVTPDFYGHSARPMERDTSSASGRTTTPYRNPGRIRSSAA